MTRYEYDDIVNGKYLEKVSQCQGWHKGEVKRFELIGGPLDGEIGTRSHFGIVIFGVLTVMAVVPTFGMDDGKPLYGFMDMPQYFKYPFCDKLLIYKFRGNMRYEFLEYG